MLPAKFISIILPIITSGQSPEPIPAPSNSQSGRKTRNHGIQTHEKKRKLSMNGFPPSERMRDRLSLNHVRRPRF